LSGVVGIIRYQKRLKGNLDDPVPNGVFPILHSLGIVWLVSGIILYHLGKYHPKILDTKTSILIMKHLG
jgi:hypothetical protein